MTSSNQHDVIIIGAGAAGMMCALEAGKRGKTVLILDHAKKLAEKIRISGGGRCNFTNIHTSPANFLSQNPHFCKSPLSQYTPQDFIALIEKHKIKWHEKKLGQLFCDESSQQIIDMLQAECLNAGVTTLMGTKVSSVEKTEQGFRVNNIFNCTSLVIATGGLSIPKIGATGLGYDIARQFGLNIIDTKAALVPLTFDDALLKQCKELSGLSVEANVMYGKTSFAEGLLFTHRGLSGPSILQISSYWNNGDMITIDLADGFDVAALLKDKKKSQPKQEIHNALGDIIPKRLAQQICEKNGYLGRLADMTDKTLLAVATTVHYWPVKPSGTEGYRIAEVTLGGVDTNELSSKTMEAKKQPGLYFIGEVVDVTGHLGGYNFQWAWSSGFVAGQHV
jgi:predicted Rossmann fold flavoprotein